MKTQTYDEHGIRCTGSLRARSNGHFRLPTLAKEARFLSCSASLGCAWYLVLRARSLECWCIALQDASLRSKRALSLEDGAVLSVPERGERFVLLRTSTSLTVFDLHEMRPFWSIATSAQSDRFELSVHGTTLLQSSDSCVLLHHWHEGNVHTQFLESASLFYALAPSGTQVFHASSEQGRTVLEVSPVRPRVRWTERWRDLYPRRFTSLQCADDEAAVVLFDGQTPVQVVWSDGASRELELPPSPLWTLAPNGAWLLSSEACVSLRRSADDDTKQPSVPESDEEVETQDEDASAEGKEALKMHGRLPSPAAKGAVALCVDLESSTAWLLAPRGPCARFSFSTQRWEPIAVDVLDTLAAHPMSSVVFVWGTDGLLAIETERGELLHQWDVSLGIPLRVHPLHDRRSALVLTRNPHALHRWDFREGVCTQDAEFATYENAQTDKCLMVVSPSEDRVALDLPECVLRKTVDRKVVLFDLTTFREIPLSIPYEYDGGVRLRFTREGLLLCAHGEGSLHCYNESDGSIVAAFDAWSLGKVSLASNAEVEGLRALFESCASNASEKLFAAARELLEKQPAATLAVPAYSFALEGETLRVVREGTELGTITLDSSIDSFRRESSRGPLDRATVVVHQGGARLSVLTELGALLSLDL